MTASTIIDFDNRCGVLTVIVILVDQSEYSAAVCIVNGKPITRATITVHTDSGGQEGRLAPRGCEFLHLS